LLDPQFMRFNSWVPRCSQEASFLHCIHYWSHESEESDGVRGCCIPMLWLKDGLEMQQYCKSECVFGLYLWAKSNSLRQLEWENT
jgi:hypothetical protein